MENKASMTSLMSAFGRAYHNAHARDQIFRDTMAGELMTDAEYRAIGGYILSGIDFFAPDKKGTFRTAVPCPYADRTDAACTCRLV